MRRKKQDTAHAVVNLQGEKVTETEKILEAYEEYFKDLLTHTNEEVMNCKSENVNDVEMRFRQIMERGESQECKKINMNNWSKEQYKVDVKLKCKDSRPNACKLVKSYCVSKYLKNN